MFEAELTLLPPSVNNMYIYTARGPRPSAKMKQFKAKASMEIAKQIPFSGNPLNGDKAHRLTILYYLPALYNKGWPSKAKTRFKRRDVSNLVKVLEDVLAGCLGIDDSCFTEVSIKKLDGPTHGFEGIKLKLEEIEDDA